MPPTSSIFVNVFWIESIAILLMKTCDITCWNWVCLVENLLLFVQRTWNHVLQQYQHWNSRSSGVIWHCLKKRHNGTAAEVEVVWSNITSQWVITQWLCHYSSLLDQLILAGPDPTTRKKQNILFWQFNSHFKIGILRPDVGTLSSVPVVFRLFSSVFVCCVS